MRLSVNIYERPGAPLSELKAMSWSGARRDVSSAAETRLVIDQHVVAGMRLNLLVNLPPSKVVPLALVVVAEAAEARRGIAVEVGNEWDLSHSPGEARDAWSRIADAAADTDVGVVTGGISSLSDVALDWLAEALPRPPWWTDLVCGFHAYNGNRPVNASSRRRELEALRSVIGFRAAWNTETGWHQASVPKDFPLCWTKKPGLTEDQVLDNLAADVDLHERAGVEEYTVYQLNDGPRDVVADRFGIRAHDGRWKRQALLPVRVTTP